MKFLIVALVACLVLEAVLSVPAGGGGGNKCQKKSNGKYPEPGTGCKKWYECKQKKYYGPYNCRGAYEFDDNKDKCMPADEVKC